MASSTENSSAPNLATLLAMKRKIAAKNPDQSNANQLLPPPATIRALSNEKTSYRQDIPGGNPQETTTATLLANTTEPPKISRKTKQLEINLLDQKMEEINRKQEAKTNEALGAWKGFDSLNYGFGSVPSVSTKQSTPTTSPLPQKQSSPVKTSEKTVTEPPRQASPIQQQSAMRSPSPKQESPAKQQSAKKPPSPTPRTLSSKRVDSPVEAQPRAKSPLKEEKPRRENPSPQKTIQKQPSPSPSPNQESIDKKPSPSPPPPARPRSTKKQPSPPPRQKSVERQPSPPRRQKSVERQPSPPRRQKSVERQPSPPRRQKSVERQPSPPPRRSKVNSASSLEKPNSPEQERARSEPFKTPTPVIENIIPISSIISNPQIFEKNVQPFEQSVLPTSTDHQFKLFPDIKNYETKRPKNAHKSIQRSMDRYRFHVW